VRFAVIGHVEWVTFAVVDRVPAAGEIAAASETFEDAAGGGAVAAVQLRKLTPDAAFFTSTGDERTATRLRGHDVTVHAALAPCAQRRAFTHLDAGGERTITVTGERHVPRGADDLPWDDLAACDAVYVVGADPTALRKARAAKLLIVSPRACDLAAAAVPIDVLVRSSADHDEEIPAGIDARVIVTTEGERGGTWRSAEGPGGRYDAAPLPRPVVDAYGCGDSFAAALTFALGSGERLPAALARAARCGAAALTGRGPYAGQLTA
jgi:ribokinase